MSAATKLPEIEVLVRSDSRGRSLRVQREHVVCSDGVRRPVLAVVVYRLLHGGRWHREKSINIRTRDLGPVSRALAASVPAVVDPSTESEEP